MPCATLYDEAHDSTSQGYLTSDENLTKPYRMKVYKNAVSDPIKTLLNKRLAFSESLAHSGAHHFAFADASQRKQPSATQAFMEAILAGVPKTVGKSERVLLVRFGLSAPGLGEGFTCCYDALLADDALICCEMGLDYGGRHLTIYARAPTSTRLGQLLDTIAACGTQHKLVLEKTTGDRLQRIKDIPSFGIPYIFDD